MGDFDVVVWTDLTWVWKNRRKENDCDHNVPSDLPPPVEELGENEESSCTLD